VDGRYVPFYVRMPLGNKVAGVPAYDKPVVALVDGGCYSTTDITLALLAEFKRVTLVGSPNGAGSGSPIPFVLPNAKVKVMVPHARAYPPSGAMIEGRPLTPDLPVEVTQQDLAAGVDRHLATALAHLAQELGLVDAGTKGSLEDVPVDQLARTTLADTLDAHAVPEELRPLLPAWMAEAELRAQAAKVDLGALRRASPRR
jgi:C-terminal processing protease CtpA/Prc